MKDTASAAGWNLIVVGAGGSGLAAAIEAARLGARVLVLEKGDQPRGTTGWSVGSFTSSQSLHQRRAGVVDSPDAHFEDLGLFNAGKGEVDNLALRRILVDESPATLQWLIDLGVEFVGPNPEPPHRVPRMHNVVPSSSSFGYHLLRECRRLGVEVRCGWRVTDLLLTDGIVDGVRVQPPSGGETTLRCDRGVVLATGDFAGSRELKSRYFGPEVVNAAPVNPLATGDGILLALKYGARVLNGTHANAPRMRFVPGPSTWLHRLPPHRIVARALQFGWRWMPAWLMRPFLMKFITTALGPEPTLFKCGAVLVDPSGDRITVDPKNIALHLPLTPDNRGFIVFDSACARQLEQWPNFVSTAPGVAYAYLTDYRRARRDIYAEAPTIAELARAIGADPQRLQASLGSGKSGPFVALGPVRGYVTITEGGLAVNERLQVLKENGEPIPGLYAAGSTGQGGLLIEGHGHHISWAFVSGRLAGRHAASRATAGAHPSNTQPMQTSGAADEALSRH